MGFQGVEKRQHLGVDLGRTLLLVQRPQLESMTSLLRLGRRSGASLGARRRGVTAGPPGIGLTVTPVMLVGPAPKAAQRSPRPDRALARISKDAEKRMSGRSVCQTVQYFSRERAMARSTRAVGMAPVTIK